MARYGRAAGGRWAVVGSPCGVARPFELFTGQWTSPVPSHCCPATDSRVSSSSLSALSLLILLLIRPQHRPPPICDWPCCTPCSVWSSPPHLAMSSGSDAHLPSARRLRSPTRQHRASRTSPKPSRAADDDDDEYVTHALQALHELHAHRATDDRKESEEDELDDKREAERRQRTAQPSQQHTRQHRRHDPVRRHSSEKTSRSSSRQHTFPFSDSSSSLSTLLTASTTSASSSGSSHAPSSPTHSGPLDRAYTARFRHLSAALLNLLSSMPSDPSLPALLRSPLTASYLSERLRELLVKALEDEREIAVRRAWEAKAAEEDKRRRAEADYAIALKERAEDKARWEDERARWQDEKATMHRQLQQCEQSLRAERHSNEQWEAQRQLLERSIKDEQQQREETEADCQRLEQAFQQLQAKYKQQQQAATQLQQQLDQSTTQLTQLQHAHTALTSHNTQLNQQLNTQHTTHQAEVKELTVELSQRKLALLHKEEEWRVREERAVNERRAQTDKLGREVKDWKKQYSEVATRVKALVEERAASEQKERHEADKRARDKAALESEAERLKAALQEQKDRTDEGIARMRELTVREWKEREAELRSAIEEEYAKAEELLGWVNHSSEQMAAMKQRLLSEREEKAKADAEWQSERQQWEQTTKQREEQLRTAEQAIAAQQQQTVTQSQQLAADIDKHHSQLGDANQRANTAQQQLTQLQADLRIKELELAQQRQETKELLAHARLELASREKEQQKITTRMQHLQPQLLHNARRLTLLHNSHLPRLLVVTRQLRQQHQQLGAVWRLQSQSMAVGWEGLAAVVARVGVTWRAGVEKRDKLDEETVVSRRNVGLLVNAVASVFGVPLPLQHQLLSAASSSAFLSSLQALHSQLSSFAQSVRDEREALQSDVKAREEAEQRREEQRQQWLKQQHQQLQQELTREADERIQQHADDVARRLAEVERVCSQWLGAEDDSSSRLLWHERLSIMLTILRGASGATHSVAAGGLGAFTSGGGVDGMCAVLDEMRRAWEVRVQEMAAGVL